MVKATYDMVVRACVNGDCALIHYLVVIGSVPNPWVIKDSRMSKGVEDGFKAWGIDGFLSVVKRGVREGVKPKLAIVGGFIDPGARELAKSLGVDIKPIVRD